MALHVVPMSYRSQGHHPDRRPPARLSIGLLALTLALPTPGASQIEVHEASIAELQAALADGTVTSAGLIDAYLARIAAYGQQGPALNAMIMLNPRAREEAEVLDREGLAAVSRNWPSHAGAWEKLWAAARLIEPERQRTLIANQPAAEAAEWLDELAAQLWIGSDRKPTLEVVA